MKLFTHYCANKNGITVSGNFACQIGRPYVTMTEINDAKFSISEGLNKLGVYSFLWDSEDVLITFFALLHE